MVRSRMEALAGSSDRGLSWLLGFLALGLPTVFARSTHTVFTVPKFTLLLLGALLAGSLWAVAWAGDRTSARISGPVAAVAGSGALLGVLLVLGTGSSEHQGMALLGSGYRYSGLVTWLSYLVLLGAGIRAFRDGRLLPLVVGIVGSTAIVTAYGLVQAAGADPFEWAGSLSFGIEAQSTLGNPNFASALLVIGAPLVVAVLLLDRSPAWVRPAASLLFASSMVMVAEFSSTQGDVGAVLCVPVALSWAWTRARRAVALALVLPVPLLVVSVPLVLRGSSTSTWWAVVGLGAAWGAVLAMRLPLPGVERGVRTETGDGRWTRIFLPRNGLTWTVVGLLGAGTVLGGWYVLPGVVDGLTGRRHLWSTAWQMFLERPLLGHGLGTYGTAFGRLRPVEHAMASEAHLSDSPHSIPLDLLSGGGLLALVAYAVLVVAIGLAGIRGIRNASGDARLVLLGVGGGWLAYHAQSLVSVDTVGLGWAQWLLGGALVAAGREDRDRGSVGNSRRWPRPGPGYRMAAAGVVVVAAMAIAPWAIRPLRADLASSDARWAMASGDLAAAASHFDHAMRLEPRNGEHVGTRALVARAMGQAEDAYRLSSRAVELVPGNPLVTRQAARDAVLTWRVPGRLAEARAWYREVVRLDPHVSGHRQEAADFLSSIGRLDEARAIMEDQGP